MLKKRKDIFTKWFNGFLSFVLFFNFIFFAMEQVFADDVGAHDRVRQFNELKYSYTPLNDNDDNMETAGFQCKPGGIKTVNAFDSIVDAIKGNIKSNLSDISKVSFQAISNILLYPLFCIGFMKSMGGLVGKGEGLKTAVLSIAMILGEATLDYLEERIVGENDYNLDPTNPYCASQVVIMLTWCLVLHKVFKKKFKKKWQKLLVILGLNVTIYAATQGISYLQLRRAERLFDNLSFCGDDWYSYGSAELVELADGKYVDDMNVWLNYVMTSYPLKGVYPGSYSHKLQKCFREKNTRYCNYLFPSSGDGLTRADIDAKANMIYKPYREFYYGGREYAYSGCSDPRPERKSYLSTSNSIAQLYYFRGSESANFACDRFLVRSAMANTDLREKYLEAYRCCIEASQKSICIKNAENDTHVICDIEASPGKCKLTTKDVEKEEAKSGSNNYCAELKKTLEQNRADLCEGDENCTTIDEIYEDVCDDSGKLKDDVVTGLGNGSTETDPEEGIFKVVKIKIRQSVNDSTGNKYCAETYNLCPYNFPIMGGTEKHGTEFAPTYKSGFIVKKDSDGVYTQALARDDEKEYNSRNNCSFDENGNRHCLGPCYAPDEGEMMGCYGKASNFCQIDRHCVTIKPIEEVEREYTSPYIDQACIDNIGSSHNFDNYEPLLAVGQRSRRLLIAPLVECTVETFKNILMNRAGHTRCTNAAETPIDNVCYSGSTEYSKGQDLDRAGYKSPFKKIKSYFLNIVRALMALAVMLYGYNMILYGKGATGEEAMKFILSMILVGYFSVSNSWIVPLFKAVYNIYDTVTTFAVQILTENKGKNYVHYDDPKYSGCHFFEADDIFNNYELYGDRKYLAVFDTFDCNFANYIGFNSGSGIVAPTIILMLVSGILTFGLSVLMIMPLILMFVALLFLILRMAYIFIVNSLTLTILLFLTPIFVPLFLFERTKEMFKSWLLRICQTMLSPLFIFMAFSLFLVIFNKYFYGETIFYGKNEPHRDMYCGSICRIDANEFFYIDGDDRENYEQECNLAGGKIEDLTYKTPACFISQTLNSQMDSGTSLITLFISGVAGSISNVASFIKNGDTSSIFNMFFSVLFLLVIIFLFEQMVGYVNSMSGVIFANGAAGYSGADDNASGLPSLQSTMGAVAQAGAKAGNSLKNVSKAGVTKGFDSIKGKITKGKEKRASRQNGPRE